MVCLWRHVYEGPESSLWSENQLVVPFKTDASDEIGSRVVLDVSEKVEERFFTLTADDDVDVFRLERLLGKERGNQLDFRVVQMKLAPVEFAVHSGVGQEDLGGAALDDDVEDVGTFELVEGLRAEDHGRVVFPPGFQGFDHVTLNARIFQKHPSLIDERIPMRSASHSARDRSSSTRNRNISTDAGCRGRCPAAARKGPPASCPGHWLPAGRRSTAASALAA